METAVLGRQEYFQGRFRSETLNLAPSFKPRMRNPNPNFSGSRRRKPRPVAVQSNPRGRSHPRSMMVATFPAKTLAMGEVKILKRGESLSKSGNQVSWENRKPRDNNLKIESHADLILGTTDRLGPDPDTVQKQVGVKEVSKVVEGIYAGSAFVTSPPPSSLPVPGFLGKKINGIATNDLRRLLKLDLV